MTDHAPTQLTPHLDEIADRLWSNRAAVMVGAGLSQNAEPRGGRSASLPSWKDLGDRFYRKLHGRGPGNEERYLSLLKLAEQVQAAFGRPALDDLLRRAIPDLSFEPSSLHGDLLALPWRDVFTTNYDTLLERTRASATLRHYDVVVSKEDLLYAKGPRIVKLHGSFPSPPFVITEEDYRRYPRDHAPFVNTVRQSLLENTLCLIGFSGDDPNFLQWIGWIRDHLGKDAAPKIYMVGVFGDLNDADRRLLDGRGIVAVDLSGFDREPGAALAAFVAHLRDRRTRTLDWAVAFAEASPDPVPSGPEKYAAFVTHWRRQREAYPGWVVVPEDQRAILWMYTQRWVSRVGHLSTEDRAKLETPLDLDLAFELAWRLDRCLFPLIYELPAFLEEVAAKYREGETRMPDNVSWTPASAARAVADIRLSLMRHYREEGLDRQWEEVIRPLELAFDRLAPEQKARLQLERALQALFRFDPGEARRLLVDQHFDAELPFWQAKRAALMAELGDAAGARAILKSSLQTIRQQIGLDQVGDDLTLVSQESVVMLLLSAVERGEPSRQPSARNLLNELSERFRELTRFKCDPRHDLSSLSMRLKPPVTRDVGETTTHQFDLGMVSRTIRLGSDDEAIAAYSLLRLCEDLGAPYRMEGTSFWPDSLGGTLPRVGPFSPHWALVTIVRLGDAKAVDHLFDREYLDGLSRAQVDEYFETYLGALERTVTMLDESEWSDAKSFRSLAQTLPEVFSRLCYKCSPTRRESLTGLLAPIYGSRRRHVFEGIHRLAGRLFHSMSVPERIAAVPSLIDLPMPPDYRDLDKRDFPNLIRLLDLPLGVRADQLAVTEESVNGLLERLSGDAGQRGWALTKLAWLHTRGCLDGRQSARFGSLLWDGLGDSGVPPIQDYHGVDCARLPHPPQYDAAARAKQNLRTNLAEWQDDSRLREGLEELRHSANMIDWSTSEALDVFAELAPWWEKNKYRLHNRLPTPFGSETKIVRGTAHQLVNALSALFSGMTRSDTSSDHLEALRAFVSDLGRHDVPSARLGVAVVGILGADREAPLRQAATALSDSKPDHVEDALEVVRLSAGTDATDHELDNIADRLVEGVRWRHRPGLGQRLRVAAELVDAAAWFLTEEREAALLEGIRQIADETASGVKGNDEDGVIEIRAGAASLALALYRRREAQGMDLSDVTRQWRDLCASSEEFAEVRNAWPTSPAAPGPRS